MKIDHLMTSLDEDIKLIEHKFLDDKITLRLPECLQDANEADFTENKYPERMPEILKVSLEHRLTFTLGTALESLMNIVLKDKSNLSKIERLKISLQLKEKKASLAVKNYSYGDACMKEVGDNCIAYFDYTSASTQDEEMLYSVVYAFFVQDDIISGTFSCRLEEKEGWGYLFQNCLDEMIVNNLSM